MFVTVIHRIHDPKGFQEAEAKALEAGLPAGVALPVHAATRRSPTRHLHLGRQISRRGTRGRRGRGRTVGRERVLRDDRRRPARRSLPTRTIAALGVHHSSDQGYFPTARLGRPPAQPGADKEPRRTQPAANQAYRIPTARTNSPAVHE